MTDGAQVLTGRRVLAFWLLFFVMGMSSAWAKDYKQCVLLDVQQPSNKIVFESDNTTNSVVLDSKMLFFNTGDSFNVSVTNKCNDPGTLYVTVQVPEPGGGASRYYHSLNTDSLLPVIELTEEKKAYAEDFPKGATTLWSFVVSEELHFQGPVIFEAYLIKDGQTVGFDSKTVYINFDITDP